MTPPENPIFFFNGDADGLIAQHLLSLSGVTPSLRVTGLKRDIALLEKIAPRDQIHLEVMDVSLATNRPALDAWLNLPHVTVRWFDHHEPGALPAHPRFSAHIHTAPGVCSSLIVHRTLPGSDPRWAAAAAFGDNLPETGEALLTAMRQPSQDIQFLKELGELLNYNAYGETPADVLISAEDMAVRLAPFRDPLEFFRESGVIGPLRNQRQADEAHLSSLRARESRGRAKIFYLPSEAWARRVGSTFANRMATEDPESALAVLHPLANGTFQVSLRAPRYRPDAILPASNLAREFPTGGGRALAAGINRLAPGDCERFHKRFLEAYA